MRYWTVEEARDYLPRLKQLVEIIRRTNQVQAGKVGSQNGQTSPVADAREAVAELAEGDIILRDTTTGPERFPRPGRGRGGLLPLLAPGRVRVVVVAPAGGGLPRSQAPPPLSPRSGRQSVSTRKLIILALIAGLAILIAFAIQVTMAT